MRQTATPTGAELRRRRLECGLTVGDLARRASIHRRTLHRIEAEEAQVSRRIRALVAFALAEAEKEPAP
jgi:DNA-binding XRE family transcriptional regulator